MKIVNIIFCILFLVSAGLQYNDEDPFLWIPIYLYAAWLCLLAAKGRFFPTAYLIGISVYAVFILYFLVFKTGVIDWFQHHAATDLVQSMKAEQPWIEETREVGGLLILVVVLGMNWLVAKQRLRHMSS